MKRPSAGNNPPPPGEKLEQLKNTLKPGNKVWRVVSLSIVNQPQFLINCALRKKGNPKLLGTLEKSFFDVALKSNNVSMHVKNERRPLSF